ncbi:unnamed protein product [Phyllotreta striolata]|uniref:Uncharacterized protein n=1 Tax=Phyllotreta striolata TaxID=444603 RepID=A0A9N9XIV5_PHYSR|nr:unnamed protein product [Phyllotreta striolata]
MPSKFQNYLHIDKYSLCTSPSASYYSFVDRSSRVSRPYGEAGLSSRPSGNSECDGRCHGKYLKHIFDALKRKTSSELEEFINVNSAASELECEVSDFSFVNGSLEGGLRDFCSNYQVYGVSTSDKRIGCDCPELEEVYSNSYRDRQTVVTCPNLIPPEKTTPEPQKNLTDKSNKDIKNRPYREVYEEKSDKTGFLDRVYSMFRGKIDSCACTEASQDPKRFSEANGKAKCNSLNRYKCNRCGKLDLEKLDKRCPKLRLEEDALLFLLKLEAKQNFKQIKSIQRQLKCHLEKLNDMNQKYVSLVKIIAPEKLEKTDMYISTDTVFTRDQQSQKTSISCVCATKKKPSFMCRLFKKSKCDTSCKCCVRMTPDKSRCQHFMKKEKPKKTKSEKLKKHEDKKKVHSKECECP